MLFSKKTKTNKAFSLVEAIVLVIICVAIFALLLFFRPTVKTESRGGRCKSNLKQIGTSMSFYLEDYGYNVNYPDTNGGGFVARLYQTNLMLETQVYICPSTNDMTDESELLALVAEDKDEINTISYAGRKNKKQSKYPGLFKVHIDISLTSVVSDDFQNNPNHENMVATLFQDGHTDYISVEQGSYQPIDIKTYNNLFDPLTN